MTWELRLGDCLDPLTGLASLADKSVDHVICDPPYEAQAHTKGRRGRGRAGVFESRPIDFAQIDEVTRQEAARQAVRVARGWLLFFCQAEGLNPWRDAVVVAGGSYRRAVVWVKPDSAPQFTGDRPAQAFEMACLGWAGEGRSRWNGGGKRGVYVIPARTAGGCQGERHGHPTVKPLDLMEALVRDFTNHDDLIVDPFAGSGTTGVAAIRLGRRFIGWERDPKYHAIATRRLSVAREQMTMAGVA